MTPSAILKLACAMTVCWAFRPSASAQDRLPQTLVGGEDEVQGILLSPRKVAVVDGRVVVLESSAPFLSVYSAQGQLLQRTVREGGGPGEMRFAASFAYDASKRELWVFDTPSSRALVFAFGDSLRYVRSLRTPVNIASGCFLDGKLWVSAYVGGLGVHRLEERGSEAAVVASGGTPRSTHPAASHPLFKSFAAQGIVACDPQRRSVTLLSRRVGLAVTIDATSMTERTSTIPSFRPVVFEVEDAMALRQRLPADGQYDQVVDARVMPDLGVVVYLGEADKTNSGGGEYTRYREVRLDDASSPGVKRPWLALGSIGASQYFYRSSPVPEIAVTRP